MANPEQTPTGNPFRRRETRAGCIQDIAFWLFRIVTYIVLAAASFIFLTIGIRGGAVVWDRGLAFFTESPQTLYIFDLFFVQREGGDSSPEELTAAAFNRLLRDSGLPVSSVEVLKSGEIQYLYRGNKEAPVPVEDFIRLLREVGAPFRLIGAREYTIDSDEYVPLQQAATIAKASGGSFAFFGVPGEIPEFANTFAELREETGRVNLLPTAWVNPKLEPAGFSILGTAGEEIRIAEAGGEGPGESVGIDALNTRLAAAELDFRLAKVATGRFEPSAFNEMIHTLDFARIRGRQSRFSPDGLAVEIGLTKVEFTLRGTSQTTTLSTFEQFLLPLFPGEAVSVGVTIDGFRVRAGEVYGPFTLAEFNQWLKAADSPIEVIGANTRWFTPDEYLAVERALVWADALGATASFSQKGGVSIHFSTSRLTLNDLSPAELQAARTEGVDAFPNVEVVSRERVFDPEAFVAFVTEDRGLTPASFGLAPLSAIVGPTGELVAGFGFDPGATGISYTGGGVFPNIAGTFLLVVGAMSIALVLGILAAIYLSEYSRPGRALDLIRLSILNLSGVPSIVFGIFGFGLFVFTAPIFTGSPSENAALVIPLGFTYLSFQGWGTSLLGGCFTLAFMVLPVIIAASEESLKAIPQGFREGSLALGATKWTAIRTNVLPYAISGILTSSILGITRVAGETAPIMFTAAAALAGRLPWENGPIEMLFQSVMALPYHIYVVSAKIPQNEYTKEMQYGASFVFMVLVCLIAASSIVLRARMRRKYRW